MSFPLIASGERGMIDREHHPEVIAYISRLKDMDGYKKAAAKIEQVEGTFKASI